MRLSISVLAKETEGGGRGDPHGSRKIRAERFPGWADGGRRLEPQEVGDPRTLSTNVSEFLVR